MDMLSILAIAWSLLDIVSEDCSSWCLLYLILGCYGQHHTHQHQARAEKSKRHAHDRPLSLLLLSGLSLLSCQFEMFLFTVDLSLVRGTRVTFSSGLHNGAEGH